MRSAILRQPMNEFVVANPKNKAKAYNDREQTEREAKCNSPNYAEWSPPHDDALMASKINRLRLARAGII